MAVNNVKGANKGDIMLYTLSTCIWCRKTKQLLNELGVAYNHIDMDTCEDDEKDKALKELSRWNPKQSFPTMVVNNKECIVGFDEPKIREILK